MLEFYYLINVLLLPRLILFFRDKPVTQGKIILLSVLNLLSFFVFSVNPSLVVFASIITGTNAIIYIAENKSNELNLIRFLSFIWLVFVSGFFTGELFSPSLHSDRISFLIHAGKSFSFLEIFKDVEAEALLKICAGGLILLNEINFVIRYLFKVLDLVPKVNQKTDEQEYRTGRVIGLLERMLIYFFALSNQYAGVGFIIAAKGIIRFKELDDKKFSEYVLMGTFLSTVFSLLVAFLVKLPR